VGKIIIDYKKYLNVVVFKEFIRYCIVGGIAFLVDAGVLALFYYIFFKNIDASIFGNIDLRITLATACGFIAGLIANYILSIIFVFNNDKQKSKNNAKAFLIYVIVGVIGFALTEFGMHLGKAIFDKSYDTYMPLVKVVVAGIVLVWNYIGRKIFVYKGE
jgi:putative flippase GtrA